MQKYIFFSQYMYTGRDIKRYGAAYLASKGYDVELWTVNYLKQVDYTVSLYTGRNWKKIDAKYVKKELIKETKNNPVVVLIPGAEKYFNVLSELKLRYVYFGSMGAIYTEKYQNEDLPLEKETALIRLIHFIKKNGLYKASVAIFDTIFGKYLQNIKVKLIKRQYVKSNPNHLVICSTEMTKESVPLCMRKDVILVHAFDYDRYLETEKTPCSEFADRQYILYIDSGFGNYHNDFVILNSDNPFLEEDKRKRILRQTNELFDMLEKKYSIPVIIAGHSNVRYVENAFEGRSIIFDRTCELVKYAKFVVMTFSTAVNFALLYDKSILAFINNDFYQFKDYYEGMEPGLKRLDIEPLNLDKENYELWENYIIKVDQFRKNDYLKDCVIGDSKYNDYFVAELIEKMHG